MPYILPLLFALLLPHPPADDTAETRWGYDGHIMVGLVAAESVPEEMPAFFREAAAQLSYLNYEPDRWRDRREQHFDLAMNQGQAPEHYINFELLPEGALQAPNRHAYFDSLTVHGIGLPGPGLLPWRMLEMTQRLRVAFGQWRESEDPDERAWIEQRIINDAGILGHYVADGANPHHTTIHHNGWVGDNPRGFTTERGFHSRFESVYVRTNITPDDVRSGVHNPAQVFEDVRTAAIDFLLTSNALVERLYELDLEEPFGAETRSPQHRAFAIDRLAAGVEMLRDLWWTAWVTSERSNEATH